jgi:TolB-like protein/cytochrome c-type biogenesis protein CcmH/NrfG
VRLHFRNARAIDDDAHGTATARARMPLLAELRRRNVFKVAGAYLALGWVIVQLTGLIAPALHLPDWTVMLVLWIGVIGFPFVVVFSWVFELTPEGLKRESEIDRSQSMTRLTGRRLDFIVIGMLALAMLLFVVDRFVPRDATTVEHPTSAVGTSSVGAGHARDTRLDAASTPGRAQGALPQEQASAAFAPDAKSIAVLPFVNMSEDAGNAFFADGISEELLNLLAKIPELQVVARTSSFSFKGKDADIATVGRKLNVAHVLEGSVRKSGNRVRITAQLVRTSDSMHLWSETYDRTLDDIFAVQDEIAGAVVGQLKLKLLGEAPRTTAVNPEAYALFLQARQLSRQFSAAGFEQGNALYEQALALDPGYAAALSALARNYSDQAAYGLRPIDEGNRLARDVAARALALDPGSAQAHATLGDIAMFYDGDSRAAAAHYQRALALEPANTDIISSAGYFAQSIGRQDMAIELVSYASQHDPLNPTGHFRLGYLYTYAGRLDESIASLRRALELNPASLAARFFLGLALLLQGDAHAALVEMQQETNESFRLIGLVPVYHALGRNADSDAALAELIASKEQLTSYNIAYLLAWRGEADRAFAWLDKAVANHDAGLAEIVAQPLFAAIREDPRWLPFLRRIGKAPEQLATIPFAVELPRQGESGGDSTRGAGDGRG